jgi:hypothetical protein
MQVTNAERFLPYVTLIGFGSVLVLFFMSMRVAPPRAADCDCAPLRLDDAFCSAELVFEGTPLRSDTVYAMGGMANASDQGIDHVAVRFQVERLLKGHATTKVIRVASTGRSACGLAFRPGQRYLVFTRTEQGMPVTDRCTPSRALDTVTAAFTDSMSHVMSGQQWAGRAMPMQPCR